MTFTVYTKPDCPQCVVTKKELLNRGKTYEEVTLDIGQTKIDGNKYISRNDLLELFPGARSMPVIKFDDKKFYNLNELTTWMKEEKM